MIYLKKSKTAPASLSTEKLKISGIYNSEDVLEQLKIDFKNKCYLCENKEPHVINVEHFKPHRNIDVDRKFDWNNLFLCCGHCNNTKLAKEEYDEILNCTIEADKVETNIKYLISALPREFAVIEAIDNSAKTMNTVSLLKAIYNGTTPTKKLESANLRKKIQAEIRAFQLLLVKYDDDGYDETEKADIKTEIKLHLRDTANFTAFKRWIIRESTWFREEFAEFLT